VTTRALPPPSVMTRPTTIGKATPPTPSNNRQDMQQLIQLLLKNNLIKNDTTNEDSDKPRYDTKRSRDLYDKVSEGLPSNERYELKHNTALKYLQLLRRKSDDYSWGSILNNIDTADGPKSLLWNYREISLEDVMKEAEACWEPNHTVQPTTDPDRIQERMIRQMIGNWVRNSLQSTAYDQLELKHKTYGYFRESDSKYIYDGPTMIKLELDIINSEARVNVRDLKDQLRNATVSDYDGDVIKMLTNMELLYEYILSENKSHNDLIIDILDELHTV